MIMLGSNYWRNWEQFTVLGMAMGTQLYYNTKSFQRLI